MTCKDVPTKVSEVDSESVPMLQPETAVYTRRWYLLFIFSMTCFMQSSSWNVWGPITTSAEAVLGWEDSDICSMANFGNIAFVICVIPLCYFMDVKGMRISMIIATFLIALGTGLRCISLENGIALWMADLSAVMNSIGGVVSFGGAALFSSLWFPLDQRATATGIASFANFFGRAMSFIVGPLLVRGPEYGTLNTLESSNSSIPDDRFYFSGNSSNHSVLINGDAIREDIVLMMYYYTAISCSIFMLVVLYFPTKPPLPPSISAAKERTGYLKGLSHLIRNGGLWLVVLASALPGGVLGPWGYLLNVILKPLSVSQYTAGYIGLYMTLAGCFANIAITRFSDIFKKRMKLFLIISFCGAICSTAWFTLICQQYIPYDKVSLYFSAIGIGMFIHGCSPLFYEQSCEVSYPVSEGITGGFLTLISNLAGIMFLLIMLIPNIGNAWMNWALLGSIAIALPMLCVFPERYERTDIDLSIDSNVTVNKPESEESKDRAR